MSPTIEAYKARYGQKMPREIALKVVKSHGISHDEFFADFKDQESLDVENFFGWLGY